MECDKTRHILYLAFFYIVLNKDELPCTYYGYRMLLRNFQKRDITSMEDKKVLTKNTPENISGPL